MKELKAGQWIRCIFNGVAEQQFILEKNKWYEIGKIENDGFFVNLDKKNVLGLTFSFINNLDDFVKFDLENSLDYNPDELEEARLKRKAVYYKFKVGDKVRIISDTSFSELRKLKIGSIGKIVEIADGHTMSQKPKLWVKVEFDDKVINQYFSSELEVVTELITPKFKVGDRVRILKDAVVDTRIGTVLITESNGVSSAIGKIGVISNIGSGGYVCVNDLPSECMESSIWGVRYSMDSIEIVTDDEPKFKVGDKVRVIKQVEFLSIAEFGKDAIIDKDIGDNQYLILFNHPKTGKYCFRVTNDQIELIEEDHEEITPENIVEVLKYNNIDGFSVKVCDGDIYFENIYYKSIKRLVLDEENHNWLQHIELEVGKLKPLPKKKEPTFENALIELGFEFKDDTDASRENTYIRKYVNVVNWARIARANQRWDESSELIYTTKEQLAKDIAAFEEKHKEPTLEEVLVELGFEEIRYNYYKNEKKGIYICILHNSNNKFWIGKSRGTLIPPYELKAYTTKEQLAKDIAAFEEKHKFRPHWSLVDDGGHGEEIDKLYPDKIKEATKEYVGIYPLHAYFNLTQYRKLLNIDIASPTQYIGVETDFGILCKDGSFIKAFWRGEE